MSDYLTLTEFVPGTKAKAQEVNANFSILKDAINSKSAKNGDSTQLFSVANATEDLHAVNKRQLDAMSTTFTAELNKGSMKFCVLSGNTTSGKGDLFSYEVLRITPKIAGTYEKLVLSDYKGTITTISSTPANISMTGKPDGTYNIFIKPDGTLYTLSNRIYRQPARPTMLDGDIWLNTVKESFSAVKYDGTNDIEFLDIPLGKVTVSGSLITAIETFAFNQNGHNVNTQSILAPGTALATSISNLLMPNYKSGVSKSWGITYTAETNGYVYGYIHGHSDALNTFTVNGVNVWAYASGGGRETFFIAVAKGDTYIASIAAGDTTSLIFYPCLGV